MKFEGILIIIIKKKRVTLSNVNVSLVAVHNSTSSCLLGHVGALETKSQYIYIFCCPNVQLPAVKGWRYFGGRGTNGLYPPMALVILYLYTTYYRSLGHVAMWGHLKQKVKDSYYIYLLLLLFSFEQTKF